MFQKRDEAKKKFRLGEEDGLWQLLRETLGGGKEEERGSEGEDEADQYETRKPRKSIRNNVFTFLHLSVDICQHVHVRQTPY